MADALVFGGSNGLVSKLADGLADILGVPVRYQHVQDDDGPGVAICTNSTAFTAAAPLVVYADDERGKPSTADPDRVAALGTLAEAVAAGRCVVVVSSKGEANRWLKHIAEDGLPEARPLTRMNIVGESGSGKTTLANRLGPLLDLPVFSVDELFWEDEETRKGGARARDGHVDQILSGERWLADGVYWRPAIRFSTAADVTLHLDFPSGRAKRQREARGKPDRQLREQVVVSTLLRAYPIVYERLLRRSLSEISHLTPILEIRNDAELEAVAEGFRRGTEHSVARQSPEADEPVGTA